MPVEQLANRHWPIDNHQFFRGVLAQLVERLNGIEEVRGSNPLGSSLRWRRQAIAKTVARNFSVGGERWDADNQRTSST